MQEVQHDEFRHKSHKVQQRIKHELPLNHSFIIFLASFSPLWHQFPKRSINHPSAAEAVVVGRKADMDKTEEEALEPDTPSRNDQRSP